MARYAVALTTKTWDAFTERQFERTRAHVRSGEMVVLADETDGRLAVPPKYRKHSVTEADVRALGLQIEYLETLFCHNLDYRFIVFSLNNPQYDYYVFLDSAACIDTDVDTLIGRLAGGGIDLAAQPVAGRMEDWVYTRVHGALYPADTIRGAVLQVAILSKAALAHLHRRRLDLSRRYDAHPDFFWPCCEAFVPTELALAGFACAPLSRYGSVERYDWWPPLLETALPDHRQPGFIHPLLDQPRYIASMLRHTKVRDLLGRRLHGRLLESVPLRAYMGALVATVVRKTAVALGRRLWRAPWTTRRAMPMARRRS